MNNKKENHKQKIDNSIFLGKFKTNADNSLSVEGNIFIGPSEHGKSIPLKIKTCTGYIAINGMINLINLCGFPKICKKYIIIKNCDNLISLFGISKEIIGNFALINCKIIETLDNFPEYVGGAFDCHDCPKLSYSEICKIVDRVNGDIYYSSKDIPENKDKLRRDRDMGKVMEHDELGSLDI